VETDFRELSSVRHCAGYESVKNSDRDLSQGDRAGGYRIGSFHVDHASDHRREKYGDPS